MSKKHSGRISWLTILLILIGIGLVITYWYFFLAFAIIIGVLWFLNHRQSAKAKRDNQDSHNFTEDPIDGQTDKQSDLDSTSINSPVTPTTTTLIEPDHPDTVTSSNSHPYPTIHRIRRALKDFVVFDIETTGLNSYENEIIQLSAIKVIDDKVVDTFNSYIKPHWAIPQKIVFLTGITNETVNDAPSISDVMPKFVEFTDNMPLVGHNIIRFDLPFVINNGFYYKDIDALDTWVLARNKNFPEELENLKLPTLKRYFGITNASHNAIEDCKTNMLVYQRLRDDQLESTPAPVTPPTHELDKLRFAITGEFIGISRDELVEQIVAHGGRVTKSVSKMTDFLLDGTQVSERLTDGVHSHSEISAHEIQENGGKIQIIDYKQLQSMFATHE